MRVALFVFLLVGCSARVGLSVPDAEEPEPTEADVPVDERILTADGAFDCAASAAQTGVCDGDEGCLRTASDGCRAMTNDCERVVPLTAMYAQMPSPQRSSLWPSGAVPTFAQGDPCAAVDPACGFDAQQGVCQPFVPVPECPETAESASQTRVMCTHPDQAQLVCEYPGIRYECGTPWRPSGGRAPAPGTFDIPDTWLATPDYDDVGCPLTERARQSRCRPPTHGECLAYDVRYSCPNGRWIGEAMPGRP